MSANFVDKRYVYQVTNEITHQPQRCVVEDWRKDWVKEGELLGLPVVRICNPRNTELFYLMRPYFQVTVFPDGKAEVAKDEMGKSLFIFASPLLNHPPKVVEICAADDKTKKLNCSQFLCPVYLNSIGPCPKEKYGRLR